MFKYLSVICICLLTLNISAVVVDGQEEQPQNTNFVPNYKPVFTKEIYNLGYDIPIVLDDGALFRALYNKKLEALKLHVTGFLETRLKQYIGINDDRLVCKIVGGVLTAIGTSGAAGAACFFGGPKAALLVGAAVASAGWSLTGVITDLVAGEEVDQALILQVEKEIEAWVKGLLTEEVFQSERIYILEKYHGNVSSKMQGQIEQVLIEARDRKSHRYDPIKFVYDALRLPKKCKWLPPESGRDIATFAPSVNALFENVLQGGSILSDYPEPIKEQFKEILQKLSSCARNSYTNQHDDDAYMVLNRRYVFFDDPGIGIKKAPEAIAESLGLSCYHLKPETLSNEDLYGTTRYVASPKRGELVKAFLKAEANYQNVILVVDLDYLSQLDGNLKLYINNLLQLGKFYSEFYNFNIDLSKMHIIFTTTDFALADPEYFGDLVDQTQGCIEFDDLPVEVKRTLIKRYVVKNRILDHSAVDHEIGAQTDLVDLIMDHKSYLTFAQMVPLADKLATNQRKHWDDILGLYKPADIGIVPAADELSNVYGFIFRDGKIYRAKLDAKVNQHDVDAPVNFSLNLDGDITLDTEIIGIDSDLPLNGKKFIPHHIKLLEAPYLYYKDGVWSLVRLKRTMGVLKPDSAGIGSLVDWQKAEFTYAEKTGHTLVFPDDAEADAEVTNGLYYVIVNGNDLRLRGLDNKFQTTGIVNIINGLGLLDNIKVDASIPTYEGIYDQIMMPYLRALDFEIYDLTKNEIEFLLLYLVNPRQKDLCKLNFEGDYDERMKKAEHEDPHSARKLYRKIADATNRADAQYKYGLMLLQLRESDDVRSAAEARVWIRKAADQLYYDAMVKLSDMFLEGLGGEKSVIEGKKWRRKCAEHTPFVGYIYDYARRCHSGAGWSQDLADARKFYKRAADKNHSKAAYYLATFFRSGIGGDKDEAQAKKYMKIAADKSDVSTACYEYAMMGPADAKAYFEKSADKGHKESQYEYATRCYGDEKKTYLKKAADQSHKEAQKEYADCIRYSNAIEARKYYKKTSEKGLESAQEKYADMCFYGQGGSKDYHEARKYYKKLVENGKTGCERDYAWLCHNGEGGAHDYKASRKYYKLVASRENDAWCYTQVAWIDYYGKDGAKSETAARANYKAAADLGSTHGQYWYAELCYYGTGGDKDHKEARKYYRMVESSSDLYAKAQYSAGVIDYNGSDGSKSHTAARSHLKTAADKGHADAQFRYGKMLYYGEGGDKNESEADRYIRKAAAQGDSDAKKWINDGCCIM
jgi:TPR repeat protein